MSYFEFPHTRTYDSDLGWIIKTVKALGEAVDSMEDWKTQHEAEYLQLKALYDAVMAGNFPPSFVQAFTTWMLQYGMDLIGELAKMVFFGITDNGYWVAYIPESWEDIIFNTTELDIFLADYPEYGRLVLSFNIGG